MLEDKGKSANASGVLASLFAANEVRANRLCRNAHIASVLIGVVLVLCYRDSANVSNAAWICRLFAILAPVHVFSLVAACAVGFRHRSAKYILLFGGALASMLGAGLVGSYASFLLFFPIALTARYFDPGLTVATTAAMIPLCLLSHVVNVWLGLPDFSMLHLPAGATFNLDPAGANIFLDATPDRPQTLVNHIVWQFPSGVLFLMLFGLLTTAVSAAGRRLAKYCAERMQAKVNERDNAIRAVVNLAVSIEPGERAVRQVLRESAGIVDACYASMVKYGGNESRSLYKRWFDGDGRDEPDFSEKAASLSFELLASSGSYTYHAPSDIEVFDKAMEAHGARTLMLERIYINGKPWGHLCLLSKRENADTAENKEAAVRIARILAIVLRRSASAAAAAERQKNSDAMEKELAALQSGATISEPRLFLEAIRSRFGAGYCYLSKYGKDGISTISRGFIVSASDLGPDGESWQCADPSFAFGHRGEFSPRGLKTVYDGDVEKLGNLYGGSCGNLFPGMTTLVACPVFVKGMSWGALCIAFPEHREIGEIEGNFLVRSASVIGSALERKEVYAELSEARDAAQRENEFVNRVINFSPVACFVKDADDDFRYIRCNAAYARHMRRAKSEIIGRTDGEILAADAARAMRERDALVVDRGGLLHYDGESFIHRDEGVLVERWDQMMVTSDNRRLIICFLNDITKDRCQIEDERRLRDAYLEQHELASLWENLVNAIPLRIYIKDADNDLRYMACNKFYIDGFGFRGATPVGKRAEEIYPLEIARGYTRSTLETLALNRTNVIDEFDKTPDGCIFDIRTTETPYRTQRGRHLVFGYSIDMTDDNTAIDIERKMSEILRLPFVDETFESFLGSAFRILSSGGRTAVALLGLYSADGKLVASYSEPGTGGFADITGELLAKIADGIKGDILQNGVAAYDDFPQSYPEVVQGDALRRITSVAVLPVAGSAPLYVALAFKIRQRFSRRYLEKLPLLAEALSVVRSRIANAKALRDERDHDVAAEKSKTYFFSAVSHDIRTPLNSIIGFADVLASCRDEGERKQYIANISNSGRMLLQLLNDVIDFSRLEAGKMRIVPVPCDFKALATEVLDLHMPGLRAKGLQLSCDFKGMPRKVFLDPKRTRQIIFNLVGNAVKFTRKGKIDFSASFAPAEGGKTGTMTFSVADTGIGIARDKLAKIMQPFMQDGVHLNNSGNGMGLPIADALAKRMNGSISVESEPGHGSVFTVTLRDVGYTVGEFSNDGPPPGFLPEKPVLEPAARPQLRAVAPPNGVLLVDDINLNLMVLKALLAKLGITDVVCAANGREAKNILSKRCFDYVLTDLWMPELDGFGLAREIAGDKTLKDISVYAVTADISAQKDCMEAGFTGVLFKPVTLDRLVQLFGVAK